MKYCPNCGKKLEENADICLKCGKLINNNYNDKRKNSSIGPIGIVLIVIFCLISFMVMIFSFLVLIIDSEDDYIEDIRYSDDYYYDRANYKGTINDTLYYDDLGVTLVSGVVYNNLVVKGDKINAKDGYEYLVIKFKIKNNSNSDKSVNINKFKGYLDGEPVNYINDNDNKLDGVVKANSIVTGEVIYEVKKGWNRFNIIYDDMLEFNIKSNTYKERKRVEF